MQRMIIVLWLAETEKMRHIAEVAMDMILDDDVAPCGSWKTQIVPCQFYTNPHHDCTKALYFQPHSFVPVTPSTNHPSTFTLFRLKQTPTCHFARFARVVPTIVVPVVKRSGRKIYLRQVWTSRSQKAGEWLFSKARRSARDTGSAAGLPRHRPRHRSSSTRKWEHQEVGAAGAKD